MRYSWVAIGSLLAAVAIASPRGIRRDNSQVKVASYHDELLDGLLAYSTTWLDAGDNLWKPAGGDRIHLSRLILPKGGFVEFSLPVSGVFFYFEKSDYRSAKAFITRKQRSETAHDYLETGFEFAYTQDPGPDSTMGFGQSFTPPIVALWIEGPCVIEDIVYDNGVRP